MRAVSNDYKNQINQMGREIECIITAYKDNEQETVLTNEEIIRVINDFEGNILKSVMKELDFETTINLSIGTKLRFQFGVKVNGEFEYVDYGYYYIKEKNKHRDTNTFEYICYDKLLNSMVDYDGVTANCNLREFINRLCTKINIDFGSNEDEFVNYDMQVAEDYFLFEGISYTYRDILDKIAEATASIICVNNNEELVVRYPNETNEEITKDSLYNNNILVDEVYGPVNSLTITRADTTDNINIKDDFSIETYGKTELTIVENEFLQGENRATLLENIFNSIKGLKYNVLDINTTGITYLELGDYYNLNTNHVLYPREDLYPNENLYPKGTLYKCLMLGSTLRIQNGLNENLYCNVPSTDTPEFVNSHADEIDRNAAKIIVDKKLDEIDITADKIHLEGYTTINNGFSVDENGNMRANGGTFTGGKLELNDNVTPTSTLEPTNLTIISNIYPDSYNKVASTKTTIKTRRAVTDTYAGQISLGSDNGTETRGMSIDLVTGDPDQDEPIITLSEFNYETGRTTYRSQLSSRELYADTVSYQNLVPVSLEELKKNIEKYEKNALKIIKKADIYQYNYKNEKDIDKKRIGMIIGKKYKTPKEIIDNNNKGIDLYSMSAILWKAIQEQQEQIDFLKEEIKKLKESDK